MLGSAGVKKYNMRQDKSSSIYFEIMAYHKNTAGQLSAQLKDLQASLTKIETMVKSSNKSMESLSGAGSSALSTVGDIANTISKGVIQKKVISVSKDPKAVFTLPFPSSCSESYRQSFNSNHTLNLTEKKFQLMTDLVGATLNLVPLVGAGVGAGASNVMDSLYNGIKAYAQRSGAIIDPNVMQVYTGPSPRSISLAFNFIPQNADEVKNIIKGIKALKEYSLATSRKVFDNNKFPIRFLETNTVVTVKFIGIDGNKDMYSLNHSINSFIKDAKIGSSTQGFVIENITTNLESLESTGGFYFDGGFRKITLNIELAELQPIYSSAWTGIHKPPKGGKYYNMKNGDSTTTLDNDTIMITAYASVDDKPLKKLKSMISTGSAGKGGGGSPPKSGSTGNSTDNTPITITDANAKDEAGKWVKLSNNSQVEGPNAKGLLSNIPGFSTIKNIGDASKDIITSAVASLGELYSESDSKMAYNERVNVSYGKGGALDMGKVTGGGGIGKLQTYESWAFPTPRSLSADSLQHQYSSEGIDNQARLENLVSKSGGALAGVFAKSGFSKQASDHRSMNSLGSMFAKGMGEMFVTVAKEVKDTAIRNIQRQGVTLDPFEVQVYNGTSLKAYALSYTILFRNREHYDNVMKGLVAMKFRMSPSNSGPAEAILLRPCNFVLSFGNEYLNDLYDVSDRILDLVSIDTTYSDDTVFTEDGLPSHIQVQINFIEHAPRRAKA